MLTKKLALAAIAGTALLAASSAFAGDRRDWDHRGHGNGHWNQGYHGHKHGHKHGHRHGHYYYQPRVVVAPPAHVYYTPPQPVVVYPQPVYVEPRPTIVYRDRGLSIAVGF